MAIYAIGDVQGCYDALNRLLERIKFDPADDRLWFTGDLVNRGPQSLETLRFVRRLDGAAVCVLGNHDLHLLAVATGKQAAKPGDSIDSVLAAPDCDELVEWLRRQPLAHHDPDLGYALVHAGVAPQWTLADTLALAAEVEAQLSAPDWTAFMAEMYGSKPARWDDALTGTDRLRAIVNFLTRLRFCTADGTMDFTHKGPPGTQPAGYLPWFAVPERKTADDHIVFGHWSALGAVSGHNVYALDSGCVWGGGLTALRLDEDGGWVTVGCVGAAGGRDISDRRAAAGDTAKSGQ
jgi:bis(5'-nucleosyl)-tetraphosphatase (symmetrical)